ELRGELAEHEVLAALLDEPEDRGVPEHRRPAVAEQHLVAVGQANSSAMPLRRRLTMKRTVAWRWLVPRYSPASAARASTASWRIFEGPHPKRPSDGSRLAGMRVSGRISECAPSTICHYRDRSPKEGNPLPRISERVAAIAESATLAVDAKAKALKAAGE